MMVSVYLIYDRWSSPDNSMHDPPTGGEILVFATLDEKKAKSMVSRLNHHNRITNNYGYSRYSMKSFNLDDMYGFGAMIEWAKTRSVQEGELKVLNEKMEQISKAIGLVVSPRST